MVEEVADQPDELAGDLGGVAYLFSRGNTLGGGGGLAPLRLLFVHLLLGQAGEFQGVRFPFLFN